MEVELVWDSVAQRNLASERHLDKSFDGNRTDVSSSWVFLDPGFIAEKRRWLPMLMEATAMGDLFWVITPVLTRAN